METLFERLNKAFTAIASFIRSGINGNALGEVLVSPPSEIASFIRSGINGNKIRPRAIAIKTIIKSLLL